MRHRQRFVAPLLLSLLSVAACSHRQSLPEQNTRLVYPSLPPTKCARKPVAPAIDADDRDWARYKKADSDAGDDCRDKLDAVDAVVSKLPKGTN